MFRFSSERKRAMRRLFKELSPLILLLESPDETTFAQQCLKKNLMTSPHDLRGSRRLSVIFSMMQVTTISLDEWLIVSSLEQFSRKRGLRPQYLGEDKEELPPKDALCEESEGEPTCGGEDHHGVHRHHPLHPDHPGRHRHGHRCRGHVVDGNTLLLPSRSLPRREIQGDL